MMNENEKSNGTNGGNGSNRRDGNSGYTNSGSSPGKKKESNELTIDGEEARSGSYSRIGKRIVDIHGLSDYLGVCINTIYSWVSQGRIPHIKMGRLLRFDLDKIDAWIAKRERNVNSEAA